MWAAVYRVSGKRQSAKGRFAPDQEESGSRILPGYKAVAALQFLTFAG